MSTVDDIESADEPLQHAYSEHGEYGEPLDIRVECSFDGTVREVTLIITVGGPHIEIDLSSGTVRGHWGGDSHSAPIMNNEWVCEDAFDYYARQFEENIIH